MGIGALENRGTGRSASAVFPLIYSHSVRLRFIPNACDTENKYASSCVFAKHSLNHKTVKYLLQNVELIMTQSFREGNSSGMLCFSSRFLWELVLSWNHVLLTVPDCRKYATNNICFVLFSASTPWNHMVIIIHRVLSLCEDFFFFFFYTTIVWDFCQLQLGKIRDSPFLHTTYHLKRKEMTGDRWRLTTQK